MRITTINVNGIRAAWRKGMVQWLDAAAPDIVLLQEVRAPASVPSELFAELGAESGDTWEVHTQPCAIAGRAGVAIAARNCVVEAITTGVGADEPDVDTGRWIGGVVTTPAGATLTIVSTYLHSGQVGNAKQDQKMAHLKRVDAAMAQLREQAGDDGYALVAGDVNIVASELDIKNWKGNHNKTAGVLDEEIAHVQRWLGQGWDDVTRTLSGPVQGPYSWWSWRGKAFDNDAGWRIDYQFATPALAARAQAVTIGRAPAYDQRWSDHAPVTVDYDI